MTSYDWSIRRHIFAPVWNFRQKLLVLLWQRFFYLWVSKKSSKLFVLFIVFWRSFCCRCNLQKRLILAKIKRFISGYPGIFFWDFKAVPHPNGKTFGVIRLIYGEKKRTRRRFKNLLEKSKNISNLIFLFDSRKTEASFLSEMSNMTGTQKSNKLDLH